MNYKEASHGTSNGNLFNSETARPTENFAKLLKAIGIDPNTAPPYLSDELRIPFSFNGDDEDLLDLFRE